MEFRPVINQIITLFIIILVGYVLRKKKLINEEVNMGLTNILLDLTLPAMIISSMLIEIDHKIINNLKLTFLITVISYLSVIIFTVFITKPLDMEHRRKSVFKFLLIFGNVGYMGFPVIDAIYPEMGIFYAIVNVLVFNLLVWTYGIYIFLNTEDGKNEIRLKAMLNNGIFAIIIGFFLFITGINLGPVENALNILGEMTTPLSMLIIGSSLARVKLLDIIKDKSLYLLSSLKLLILPLIGYLVLQQFTLPSIVMGINVLLLAMPSGANGVIFAERYGGDYAYASEGIIFTTLLSLLTIPIFIYLITI